MRARTNQALRRLHLLLDAVTLAAALPLTVQLDTLLRVVMPAPRAPSASEEYALLGLAVVPMWLVLLALLGLHRTFEQPWTSRVLLVRLAQLQLIGLLGLSLAHFLGVTTVDRSLALSFLSCSFALLYVVRTALSRWVRYQHARGVAQRRVLVVGSPSGRMASFVRDARAHALPPHLIGCLRTAVASDGLSVPPPDFEPLPELGTLSMERLTALLHDEAVDEVLFFPPLNRTELLSDYVALCEDMGIHASVSVDLVPVARATPQLTALYDHPFVTFEIAPKRPELLAVKHGLDFVLALLLLLLCMPLFALTALAILLTMGRPVFFAQERAGLHGRPFSMLKFRSMVRGAEQERLVFANPESASQALAKAKDDQRVTPLGRILRKTSLDELPQLVNVLLGSMSLVGPRPLPLDQHRWLRDWQRRRLAMKPGITGAWQVSGRSELDFDRWMELDLAYIDGWSLLLDLRILLRTIAVVASGRGAH